MIVVRCPLRVSLFGGGSDYGLTSSDSPGVVVGGTVNLYLYVYLNLMPAFARERYRLTYRLTESVLHIGEIRHPIARTMLQDLNWRTPINIGTMADVPGQSGLGSSSAFTLALRLALATFANEEISPRELSEYAIHVERQLLKEPGGIQDQLYAAYGGFRRFDVSGYTFTPSDRLLPAALLDEYSKHFLLVYTGSPRSDGQSAKSTSQALLTRRGQSAARRLAAIADECSVALTASSSVREMTSMTVEALRETWAIKTELTDALAPSHVRQTIELGMGSGARAAKLLGSGGGGFVLFVIEPELQEAFSRRFPAGYTLPLQFNDETVKVASNEASGFRRHDPHSTP